MGDSQFDRVSGMLTDAKARGGKLIGGGETDRATRYIAPTVMRVSLDVVASQDETFGPILWVTPVKDMDEAIAHVARQPKSLSSYVFSGDRSVADRISQNTCAGGVTVNAVIFHCGHPELPFGGVGTSGMGNYHGTETFHCFTHKKPVLHKTTFPLPGLSDPFVLYQPWSNFKIKALRFLMAWA